MNKNKEISTHTRLSVQSAKDCMVRKTTFFSTRWLLLQLLLRRKLSRVQHIMTALVLSLSGPNHLFSLNFFFFVFFSSGSRGRRSDAKGSNQSPRTENIRAASVDTLDFDDDDDDDDEDVFERVRRKYNLQIDSDDDDISRT